VGVYVQTGSTLNRYWAEMLDAMPAVDTRPIFLLTFESALSGCMETSIYETTAYARINARYPIPDDNNRLMPLQAYRAWVTAYTEIMREFNLLGLIRDKPPELDGDISSFMEAVNGRA